MTTKTYDDGVREGKLMTIELIQTQHDRRLDDVEGRVSTLERVSWMLVGAVGLVQLSPLLKEFFL